MEKQHLKILTRKKKMSPLRSAHANRLKSKLRRKSMLRKKQMQKINPTRL